MPNKKKNVARATKKKAITAKTRWPKKTREIRTAIVDSTRWNAFRFRDGDIVIDTFGKAGTTWTQQIVGQLLLGAPAGVSAAGESPWLDMRGIQPARPSFASCRTRRYLSAPGSARCSAPTTTHPAAPD